MKYKQAIGYMRYSSRNQKGNTSIERQTDIINGVCKSKKLKLVKLYEDTSKSAFRGTNLEHDLGQLLKDVESGLIPSQTLLIIESLDRISRDKVAISQQIINRIFYAGVSIYTDSDSKTYDCLNPPITDIIILLVNLQRAHDESQLKSNRVVGSYPRRYEAALAKGPLINKNLPNWLDFDESTGRSVVNVKRKQQVLAMVDMYLNQGMGFNPLTDKINNVLKWKPWGHANCVNKSGRWTVSYVQKVLKSPALMGHYQLWVKTMDKTDDNENSKFWNYVDTTQTVDGKWKFGEVIKDYYEPMIDEKTFYRIQNKCKKNDTFKRGRPTTKPVGNLFTSLAVCQCGQKYHYLNKGEYSYLVCVDRCGSRSIPYKPFEEHALYLIPVDVNDDIELKNNNIQNENNSIQGEIDSNLEYLENLTLKLKAMKSPTLMNQVIETESLINELEESKKPLLTAPSKLEYNFDIAVNKEDKRWRLKRKDNYKDIVKSIQILEHCRDIEVVVEMVYEKKKRGCFKVAKKSRLSETHAIDEYKGDHIDGESLESFKARVGRPKMKFNKVTEYI